MTDKPKSGSRQPLDRFEARGNLGPLDLKEREVRINSLPAIEKEMAKESARFADLCQFFETKQIDIPREVFEQLTRAAKLPIAERISVMKKMNQSLMERLHDVDPGTGIRQ
jgi:hypothetical protein